MKKFKDLFKKVLLVFCIIAYSQQASAQKTIKGIVTDSTGTLLSGVSVFVKGSSKGTSTNTQGEFSITVNTGAILMISYIGYLPLTVTVGSETALNIKMTAKDQVGEAVVVVGYGKQRKATLTGAVSQIKGSDIAKAPVANITNALAGRLPGLRAVQSSGEPGRDGSSIDIRGFSNALTIVDGVPMSFSQIDPAEVESISILKDASASVYGLKASGGVILVTTKRGTNAPGKITYNTYYGLQQPTRYPKFLQAGSFVDLWDEASIVASGSPFYGASEAEKWKQGTAPGYQNTDWFDLVFKNWAPQYYNNLSFSGGTDKTKYFLSVGTLDQKGIWSSDASRFKRYNVRGNLSTKIAKNLTAEMNVGGRLEDKSFPQASPDVILNQIQRSHPTFPAYSNNNKAYYNKANIDENVLASIDKNYSGAETGKYRFMSVAGSLTYDFPQVTGLSTKLFYSYTTEGDNSKTFYKAYGLYNYDPATQQYNKVYTTANNSALYTNLTNEDNTLFNFSFNYSRRFGKHDVGGLLLFEQRRKTGSNQKVNGLYALDAIQQVNLLIPTSVVASGSGYNEPYQGYVGRFDYNYASKYLLQLAGRYDGSWKFPDGHRWGFFPSVLAGWVISKESFFHSNVINNFKIRGSWGVLGDDGGHTGFEGRAAYLYPGNGPYIFTNGTPTIGLTPGVIANQNVTWLESKISNLGVEMSFFKNMLTLETEVFYRKRTGLFARRGNIIPGTAIDGSDLPNENLNSDSHRGFELMIGFNKKIGKVLFSASPNFAYTRIKNNYIERAASTNATDNYNNNNTDRWSNISWGYHAIGQFQSMEEIATSAVQDNNNNHTLLPGDIKYADLNKDGIIDSKDQMVIGRGSRPEITYGMNLSASYKNFDISVLLQGAGNYSLFIGGAMQQPFSNNANSYAYFEDRWHKADIYDKNSAWVPGKFPTTRFNGLSSNNLKSDFWMTDANYLRMKTIELGYNVPKKILSKTNAINQVRIYVSAQNLLTFTNVDYLDPEAPNSGTTNGDGKYYPQQRVITFGVNVQL